MTDSDDPALATVVADDRRAVRRAMEVLPRSSGWRSRWRTSAASPQEIANKLGQPLGTVKTRIRLGMQKMRGVLETRRLEDGTR